MTQKFFIFSLFIFAATSLGATQQLDESKNYILNAQPFNTLTKSATKLFRLNLFAQHVLANNIDVTPEYLIQVCNEVNERESSKWNKMLFSNSVKNNRFALCYLLMQKGFGEPTIDTFQDCLKNASASSSNTVGFLEKITEYSGIYSIDDYRAVLNSAFTYAISQARVVPNFENIVFLLNCGAVYQGRLKLTLWRWYYNDKMDLVELFFQRQKVSFTDVTNFYLDICHDDTAIEKKREVISLIGRYMKFLLNNRQVSLDEAQRVFDSSNDFRIKNNLFQYMFYNFHPSKIKRNSVIVHCGKPKETRRLCVDPNQPRGFERGKVKKEKTSLVREKSNSLEKLKRSKRVNGNVISFV